jgi:flagellar biosynthesis protein FliR
VEELQIPLGNLFSNLDVLILIFIRMTGLFVIAPIFGRRNIPTYYKIGFSFFLALIIVNVVSVPKLDYYNNLFGYMLLVIEEFIVGLVIGYISYMVFAGIYLAGQLIDMQIGFGMVNVLDPVSNIQVPVTSNFYFIITMLIFLSVDGHHILIKALFESYKYIPIGGASFNSNLLTDIMRIFVHIFIIGFQIAAPIIAAILISDIVLGVMSKTIPQLNVFVVGMPLKIALGIAVIVITMPVFISFVGYIKDLMTGEMYTFIKHMGK